MQTVSRWYHFLAYFFGGAFLANTIPHLVNGISGSPFQSPFASPPGQGLSSSTVNVLTGKGDGRNIAALPASALPTGSVFPPSSVLGPPSSRVPVEEALILEPGLAELGPCLERRLGGNPELGRAAA